MARPIHIVAAVVSWTPQVHAFFLKFVLWIPPTNPLNTLRLLILFLSALPATKECAPHSSGRPACRHRTVNVSNTGHRSCPHATAALRHVATLHDILRSVAR